MMRGIGEMPEWSNGTDSKSVVLATVPRVQIPISPPYIESPCNSMSYRGFFFSVLLLAFTTHFPIGYPLIRRVLAHCPL